MCQSEPSKEVARGPADNTTRLKKARTHQGTNMDYDEADEFVEQAIPGKPESNRKSALLTIQGHEVM